MIGSRRASPPHPSCRTPSKGVWTEHPIQRRVPLRHQLWVCLCERRQSSSGSAHVCGVRGPDAQQYARIQVSWADVQGHLLPIAVRAHSRLGPHPPPDGATWGRYAQPGRQPGAGPAAPDSSGAPQRPSRARRTHPGNCRHIRNGATSVSASTCTLRRCGNFPRARRAPAALAAPAVSGSSRRRCVQKAANSQLLHLSRFCRPRNRAKGQFRLTHSNWCACQRHTTPGTNFGATESAFVGEPKLLRQRIQGSEFQLPLFESLAIEIPFILPKLHSPAFAPIGFDDSERREGVDSHRHGAGHLRWPARRCTLHDQHPLPHTLKFH